MVTTETFSQGWALLLGAYPDKRLSDNATRAVYALILCPVMSDATYMRAIQATIALEPGSFAPSVSTIIGYATKFRAKEEPDPHRVIAMRLHGGDPGMYVTDENFYQVRRLMDGGEAKTLTDAINMSNLRLVTAGDKVE